MGKVFYLIFGCWLSTTIGIIIYACLNSTTITSTITSAANYKDSKQLTKMSNKTTTNNTIIINKNKDNLEEGLLSPNNGLNLPPSSPQNAELADYETDENELGIDEGEGGGGDNDESQDDTLRNGIKIAAAASGVGGASNAANSTTTTTTTTRNGKRKKKEEVSPICVGCLPQGIGGVKKAKKANNGGGVASPNEIQTTPMSMKQECAQCQQFQKCLKSLMKTLETFINA